MILNQLLLAAILLFAAPLVVIFGPLSHPALITAGMTVVFATTVLALLVPWERIPPLVSAAVPLLDIVAIGLLRESSPTSGFGLIWGFPVMWLAWTFGPLGAVVSTALVSVSYWLLNMFGTSTVTTLASILFPTTIAALATIAVMMARRAEAQRDLLEQQSRALQRTAERARRQEALVTDVLDAVDFGVIGFDTEGSITITNQTHARLQQIRDRRIDSAFADDGVTPMPRESLPMSRARRGETFAAELIWYGEPGEDRRAFNSTARRVLDSRGQEIGTILVSRDATEEQLALRSREDLMASVSHELRTPLTSILGYLDLAGDDENLSPATRRGLEIAERNAERLLDLIADILAASASQQDGGLTIQPKRSDLADVVRAAIESAQPRAAERRITIDGTGIEPVVASADTHRIRQVVDNLLSNAIKYGYDDGHIDVGCTGDGTNAWIVVRDNGPGILQSEQPKLFDRFFRSETVRHTSTHGSGLGLAISRDIVTSHGGDIAVRSSPGEGATFIVRLPITGPMGDP